ncbi:MAG: hypothetical protein JST42_21815 [Bacteroidetes bacterium]|nr:hypothetical protein [Bacteroidota bacterium]
MRLLFSLLLLISGILPSCSRPGPVNHIGDIDACDSEIFVRNWEITRPVLMDSTSEADADSSCKNNPDRDQGDNMTSYAAFCSAYDEPAGDTSHSDCTPFVKYPYEMNSSYFFVNSYYHIPERPSFLYPVIPAMVYAASIIKSDRDQDVMFISGANNGLRMWLNGRQILRKFTTGYIQGYQYLTKVHLTKGDNFLLVKLDHVAGDWKFFLKLASIRYANDNWLGENYSGICENYLIKRGDSLHLRLFAPQIKAEKPVRLRITDLIGKEMMNQQLPPARNWTIDLKDLEEGPYTVDLTTDENTFTQYIFYGDHETYFQSFRSSVQSATSPAHPLPSSARFKENIDLLIDRMSYIDTVKVEHDNAYQRKLTRLLYEMSDMYRHFKKSDEPLTDVPGLHLRCQSSLFYSSDTYMIYIPQSYRRSQPIPLVMMLPHETGIREFTISTYVADINRIEYVMHLADKYGFAVIWSSYRIYSNHNLTRMFPDLVAKTLESVRKDYAIDDNRIYAYGDCAGGELSLFMANKYPSFFAAVGVEGPAIPGDTRPINYDFYNTVDNYRNFPTCIIHSINDEKTSFARSARLCKEISRLGGNARLDTLYVRKGTDLFFSDLMPDNWILNRLFSFYNGKFRRVPDTVWLSTYQLKFNHAFWVTIDDLVSGRKAAITATVDRNANSINVQTTDVTAFTLDLHQLRLDSTKKINVLVNNQPQYTGLLKKGPLTIDLLRSNPTAHSKKTSATEGPVNDFFCSPILLVKGSAATANQRIKCLNAIDTLRKSWHIDFLRDSIPCKTAREITRSDVENYNLILIGTDSTNPTLRPIWQHIPLRVNSDFVQIGAKTYVGKDLSYILIHPNPSSTGKYVLVLGSNSNRISPNVLVDLTFSGWHDYEIFDHDADVDAGDFNNNWQ